MSYVGDEWLADFLRGRPTWTATHAEVVACGKGVLTPTALKNLGQHPPRGYEFKFDSKTQRWMLNFADEADLLSFVRWQWHEVKRQRDEPDSEPCNPSASGRDSYDLLASYKAKGPLTPLQQAAVETRLTPVRDLFPHIPRHRGYYVYIAYGDEACLYVGATGIMNGPQVPESRLSNHRSSSEWWPKVSRIDIHEYASDAGAARFERKFIARLRPLFNRYIPRLSDIEAA